MRTTPIVGILIGLAFAALLWSQRRAPVAIDLVTPNRGAPVVLLAQAGAGGSGGSVVTMGSNGTDWPGVVVGPVEIPVGEYSLHVKSDGTWSITDSTRGWSGGVPMTTMGGSGCGPCPSISR